MVRVEEARGEGELLIVVVVVVWKRGVGLRLYAGEDVCVDSAR